MIQFPTARGTGVSPVFTRCVEPAMPTFGFSRSHIAIVAWLTLVILVGPALHSAEPTSSKLKSSASDKKPEPPKELFAGRVVLLTDALKRQDVQAYDKEIMQQVVLETEGGELWPIIPDWRGRAFFQDRRLRNRPVELVINRRPGSHYLQVLSIFTFSEKGERQATDYWCDICAIPMYEIKECECCQGPIRLRYQTDRPLPSDLIVRSKSSALGKPQLKIDESEP
jgi:hypothetical protein